MQLSLCASCLGLGTASPRSGLRKFTCISSCRSIISVFRVRALSLECATRSVIPQRQSCFRCTQETPTTSLQPCRSLDVSLSLIQLHSGNGPLPFPAVFRWKLAVSKSLASLIRSSSRPDSERLVNQPTISNKFSELFTRFAVLWPTERQTISILITTLLVLNDSGPTHHVPCI